ncbi:UDP-N-acetylmuramoyl-L-alanine--D-glutamate ligase [Blastococcus sp. Marseille-P5729]|uniref:UDP-N-acetylmuramoyl-L-alanine--D-glutamate ligase n=1 Tax=Blastococcus sp. Marseille-P5729 TaxID=2086582 RepID=UPI001F3B6BE4|nr:UDP-N-acetylmuramoyl-L-alanine--D-glutamate ligase [Blastococcus sp. Marseille-P5729]
MRQVLVAGGGRSGSAVARALAACGDAVRIVDARPEAVSGELAALGVRYAGDLKVVPDDVDLVVTSPGWPPTQPLLADALRRGLPVVGEVEIAWELRDRRIPWLAVTGTNGKTTTVGMLTAILRAGGLQAAEVGNVGPPVIDAVVGADLDYDVFAVELSSFQLHWGPSITPAAGALLNIAADHLDWHGSLAAYAADKTRVWGGGASLAVINADDPHVVQLAAALPAHARVIRFTLGEPADGELGVRDGILVDRSVLGGGDEQLLPADEIRPPGPHNVANALAAAALARSVGITAGEVAQGLRDYRPGEHRNVTVARIPMGGSSIRFVNDSKATNAHAAEASLRSYARIVWIAGGLLKGAVAGDFGGLIEAVRDRLAAVVLVGRDRAVIGEALRRHAPDVRVIDIESAEHRGMAEAVSAATDLARAESGAHGGEVVVLMAPAAASMDMFTDYAERGRVFTDAARGQDGATS